MSFIKQYLKKKTVCKVTFKVSDKEANGAKSVCIAGDFNEWDNKATPMKNLKTGGFSTTIVLETNREYEFRYILDGTNWENDWHADKYLPSDIGNWENSVVTT